MIGVTDFLNQLMLFEWICCEEKNEVLIQE